jgi:hypothetical protein
MGQREGEEKEEERKEEARDLMIAPAKTSGASGLQN